jgi:hypothetical protein
MKNVAESINYRGRVIEIIYDDTGESTDAWSNDDIFLVYDHRQFFVERKGFSPDDIFEATSETKVLEYDGYHVFPVLAYIHSGVSLSVISDLSGYRGGWDTSFRGFALVSETDWPQRDKAFIAAQSLIKEWNQYLSGEVYGYDTGSDSCWGYYGDEGKQYAIQEAKSCIDYEIKQQLHAHFKKVKAWIRSKTPLQYRKQLSF